MTNSLVNNAYGNIFNESYSSMHYILKNSFGFPIVNSKKTINNYNVTEFIDKPLIYLYNTFQTDKYQNNYYSSYSINPVVVQANFIFKEYLTKEGFLVAIEEGSVAKVLKENNISYALSYRGSRILMENAKSNYPSLQYFFDIGLSDDGKDSTTFSSSGNNYARILFIVGTEYDNYENHEFAKAWNEKLDNLMPGLSRGISLRGGDGYHGIYNQDFSTKTLLIYVGGKENTIDEVNRSLKVLATSFKEYMEDL